jgi:hypothetical protein
MVTEHQLKAAEAKSPQSIDVELKRGCVLEAL